jgi:hypothetical protein
MTRIFLGGKGDPIPDLAMPDLSLAVDLQPIYVPFTADGIFVPADYIAMGYTDYEVTCIGAAGGRGSDGDAAGAAWPYYYTPLPGGYSMTHWHDPMLINLSAWGGGGGGGGSQRVNGKLADLPANVPVAVGQAGADAGAAYIAQTGNYTPNPPAPWPDARATYDSPVATFLSAHNGGDGGASTFGPDICMASGGKGGGPCIDKTQPHGTWNGDGLAAPNAAWTGFGGQGGIGGRTLAGGGAAGSASTSLLTPADGADGMWDSDTNIGAGGGGGRGGVWVPGYDPNVGSPLPGEDPYYRRLSSSGGQGAVSFVEPGVLGPRQMRAVGSWSYPRYNTSQRASIGTDSQTNNQTTMPGTGGGAKVTPVNIFGGRSGGALAQGAVFVRVMKIV